MNAIATGIEVALQRDLAVSASPGGAVERCQHLRQTTRRMKTAQPALVLRSVAAALPTGARRSCFPPNTEAVRSQAGVLARALPLLRRGRRTGPLTAANGQVNVAGAKTKSWQLKSQPPVGRRPRRTAEAATKSCSRLLEAPNAQPGAHCLGDSTKEDCTKEVAASRRRRRTRRLRNWRWRQRGGAGVMMMAPMRRVAHHHPTTGAIEGSFRRRNIE